MNDTKGLFEPNNHSVWQISYQPVDSGVRTSIRQSLLENFSLSDVLVEQIEQVGEAEQASNNFKVQVVLPNGEEITWLVRKHILLSNESEAVFLEKTLSFLKEKKIPVPTIIPLKTGQLHFALGGAIWQVFAFEGGNHYRGEKKELAAIALGLAHLHQALESFPYQEELSAKRPALTPFSEEALKVILKQAQKNEDDIDQSFIEHTDVLYRATSFLGEFTAVSVSRQILHGDMHPHNTLFNDGALRAILDFDMMQEGERVREVAFAAHRFARQYAVFAQSGPEGAREGFGVFVEVYDKVNALSNDEHHMLSYYLVEELLRRITTDFSRYYFEGITRYATQKELLKKVMLLQEAMWLSHHAG